MQYVLISLTAMELLSSHEIHIEMSNKKKYNRMISKSPGLMAIVNKYGINGSVTDAEFETEKNRVNFELMNYLDAPEVEGDWYVDDHGEHVLTVDSQRNSPGVVRQLFQT